MSHVSAVNEYIWYDSNCIVKITRFLARKEGVSFRFAQEKSFLECQVLCQLGFENRDPGSGIPGI